ncbi:MAG: flagellar hook-basal body complex protein FliE [Janthinobacterium lividum]
MIAAIGSVMGSLAGAIGTAVGAPLAAPRTVTTPVTGTGSETSFADVFKSAANSVDSLQKGADQQITSMLTGTGDADVNKVMVSVEKADVAFQLMMQVRNKVVNAYQEMEKMQF